MRKRWEMEEGCSGEVDNTRRRRDGFTNLSIGIIMTLCARTDRSVSLYVSLFLCIFPPHLFCPASPRTVYSTRVFCLSTSYLRPCVFLICVCSEVNPYLAEEHTVLILNRCELRHVARTNACSG